MNAGYQAQQAQDLAYDMALLAVTNETPWARLEADRAQAEADHTTSVATEEAIHLIAVADTRRNHTQAQAAAGAERARAVRAAERARSEADAQTQREEAVADAADQQAQPNSGGENPALPEVAQRSGFGRAPAVHGASKQEDFLEPRKAWSVTLGQFDEELADIYSDEQATAIRLALGYRELRWEISEIKKGILRLEKGLKAYGGSNPLYEHLIVFARNALEEKQSLLAQIEKHFHDEDLHEVWIHAQPLGTGPDNHVRVGRGLQDIPETRDHGLCYL